MFIENLLAIADVHLTRERERGTSAVMTERRWEILVHNEKAFKRAFYSGILGIGESYTDGDWDCEAIDELVYKLLSVGLQKELYKHPAWLAHGAVGYLANTGSRLKAKRLAKSHYDLGNDLFKAMLDHRMVYTCGYWEGVKSLTEAQEQKLEMICQKLKLRPGMKILDIGGGWGSFAKYAAEKYKVSVVNITVSKEQVKLADQMCKGLQVENRLIDYRDLDPKEKFDRIVSIEMFEAVGYKNYRKYFEIAHRSLKDKGIFVLQTIGGKYSTTHTNPWIDKYIFPGGMLPSMTQIGKATENLFTIDNVLNIGPDYDKTLMAWWYNFDKNWPKLQAKYGDRFYRMWKLYLQGCAGSFRAKNLQVWQIVLTK